MLKPARICARLLLLSLLIQFQRLGEICPREKEIDRGGGFAISRRRLYKPVGSRLPSVSLLTIYRHLPNGNAFCSRAS